MSVSTGFDELPQPVRAAKIRLKVCTRLTVGFSLLGFTWLLFSGWFVLAALLALLLAAVLGLVSLCLMPAAKAAPFDYAIMVFLVLGCLFFSFSAGLQLVFMEETNAYADCLRHALTISRQGQCSQELENKLLGQILGSN